jgi:hypothetical protein
VLVVDTVIVVVVLEVVENVSVTVESVDVTVDTDVIIKVEVVGDGVWVTTGVETEVSRSGRRVIVLVLVELGIDLVEVDACLVEHLITEVVVEPIMMDPRTYGNAVIDKKMSLNILIFRSW